MKRVEGVWIIRIMLPAILLCMGVLFSTQALAVEEEGGPAHGKEYSVPSWQGQGPAVCHGRRTVPEHMRYRMHNRLLQP